MTETTSNPTPPGKLDPVAKLILSLLARLGEGESLGMPEVARAFAEPRRRPLDPPDVWRRYLQSVRQQALFLARRGDVALTRRGEVQDPNKPTKGVLRIARPL